MTDKSLIEQQRALHRRAEQVLTRVLSNDELMRQVEASFAAINRGERSIPLRELQEREKHEHADA